MFLTSGHSVWCVTGSSKPRADPAHLSPPCWLLQIQGAFYSVVHLPSSSQQQPGLLYELTFANPNQSKCSTEPNMLPTSKTLPNSAAAVALNGISAIHATCFKSSRSAFNPNGNLDDRRPRSGSRLLRVYSFVALSQCLTYILHFRGEDWDSKRTSDLAGSALSVLCS